MLNLDKFLDAIDSDLAWRKKEVTNILLLEDPDHQLIIVKAALLMLYSHWEGYIKNVSKLYLEYISNQKINITKLTDNFKAITLKGLIKEVHKSSETLTLSNELNFIEKFGERTDKIFKVAKNFSSLEKEKSIINTKDNLNFEVFKSILRIVGIDYSDSIDTKSVYIDEKLLNNRNKVAHGNRIEEVNDEFDLTIDDLKKVKDVVFYLMDSVAEDLKLFAENEFYFTSNNDDAAAYLLGKIEKLRTYMP